MKDKPTFNSTAAFETITAAFETISTWEQEHMGTRTRGGEDPNLQNLTSEDAESLAKFLTYTKELDMEGVHKEMVILEPEKNRIKVVLTKDALQYARIFASRVADVDIGKLNYLYTLAINGLEFYLNREQIEASVEDSEFFQKNTSGTTREARDAGWPIPYNPNLENVYLPVGSDGEIRIQIVLDESNLGVVHLDPQDLSLGEGVVNLRVIIGFDDTVESTYLKGFETSNGENFPIEALVPFLKTQLKN